MIRNHLQNLNGPVRHAEGGREGGRSGGEAKSGRKHTPQARLVGALFNEEACWCASRRAWLLPKSKGLGKPAAAWPSADAAGCRAVGIRGTIDQKGGLHLPVAPQPASLLTRTTHGDLDEVVVEVGIDMEAMWFNVAADNSGAANPSRCATRISGTCTAPAALLPRLACHLPPRCPHAQPRSSSAVQAVTFRSTQCMSALLLLAPCVLRSLLHRVMHQPRSARCAQSW